MDYEHDPATPDFRPAVESSPEKHEQELIVHQLERFLPAAEFIVQVMKPDKDISRSNPLTLMGIYTFKQGEITQLPDISLHISRLSGGEGVKRTTISYVRAAQNDEVPTTLSTLHVVRDRRGHISEFSTPLTNDEVNWYDVLAATSQKMEEAADRRIKNSFDLD